MGTKQLKGGRIFFATRLDPSFVEAIEKIAERETNGNLSEAHRIVLDLGLRAAERKGRSRLRKLLNA